MFPKSGLAARRARCRLGDPSRSPCPIRDLAPGHTVPFGKLPSAPSGALALLGQIGPCGPKSSVEERVLRGALRLHESIGPDGPWCSVERRDPGKLSEASPANRALRPEEPGGGKTSGHLPQDAVVCPLWRTAPIGRNPMVSEPQHPDGKRSPPPSARRMLCQ